MLLATFASLLLAVNAGSIAKPAFLDRIVPIPGPQPNQDPMRGEARLYGGAAVTDISAYPFLVAIPRVYYSYQSTLGQGVVISKNYVLTSGFVTYYLDYYGAYNYEIVSETLDVAASTKSGIRYRISDVISHPSFSYNTRLNNIGLVKFCPDYKGSVFAQVPPFQSTLFGEGTVGSVLSWGTDLSTLKELNQTINNNSNCSEKAAIQVVRAFDASMDFCVVLVPDVFTCSGDEGAPMMVGNTVIGLSEWGPCEFQSSYYKRVDTYTKVSQYSDWIKEAILV